MSPADRERQELRPHLRDEQPPDDRVVVVRGGPSTAAIHLPSAGQLRVAGFALFPSFGRPHYTVKIASAGLIELVRLLEALGSPESNRYHRGRRPGGR